MAATLGLIFAGRPRLLPLALRAARGGAHVRRAVGRGRVADDGLDRGAAGAGRAGGGLRDPVPVARGRGAEASQRGARRPARTRGRCAPRGDRGRADDRDRRRGERGGDARAAALAGADGARLRRCCWWSGVAIALALRADAPARRRSSLGRARRGAAGAAAGSALGPRIAGRSRGAGRASCCARTRVTRWLQRVALVGRGAPAGAGARASGSRWRSLGWGLDTQTHVRDRHHQAGAAEPRLAAEPRRRSSAPPAWPARSTCWSAART